MVSTPRYGCLRIIVFLCCLLPLFVMAAPQSLSGNAELLTIGSIRDRVLRNFRTGLNLNWETILPNSSNVVFAIEGRLRSDTQERFVSSGKHYDTVVDRAVVQWSGSQSNLLLGWQKYTWGDSGSFDGVDVLNPRDLNEPQYTDDDILKIALPSMSFQYLGDNSIFQAVVILRHERSPIPDEFESLKVGSRPEFIFPDPFEFGLKTGGLLKGGWDINGYLVSHLERVPQFVLLPSATSSTLQAYEPKVLTLGLSATQSSGDLVFRSELAAHFNRALPEHGLLREQSADQLVVHLTSDFTVWSDLVLTGEFWAEKWSEQSNENFKSNSNLLGLRMLKPLFESRVESNLGFLSSIEGNEWTASSGLSWRLSDQWQWDLNFNFVETSKGHALARRNLQDLLRSNFRYQF